MRTLALPLALLSLAGYGCSHRDLGRPTGGVMDPNQNGPDMGTTTTTTPINPATDDSFVVTGTARNTAITLTLHLDRAAQTLTVGWSGGVATTTMTGSDHITASGGFSVWRACRANSYPSEADTLDFQTFTMSITPSGVTVDASGQAGIVGGDYIDDQPFSTRFSGGLDVSGPGLAAGCKEPSTVPFPVAPAVVFNEPLAQGSAVTLVPDVGPALAMTSDRGHDVFFEAPRALAFGRSYHTVVAPFADLGGNAGDASVLPAFTTPSLARAELAGFEGSYVGAPGNGASIDGPKAPPPLAGLHSLYLPANSYFVARLPVTPGATVLRFSARGGLNAQWGGDSATSYDLYVEAAAPDGKVATTTFGVGEPPYAPDPNDAMRKLGTVVTREMPLPDGVTDELMLRISSVGPFPGQPIDVQIDDLRVE